MLSIDEDPIYFLYEQKNAIIYRIYKWIFVYTLIKTLYYWVFIGLVCFAKVFQSAVYTVLVLGFFNKVYSFDISDTGFLLIISIQRFIIIADIQKLVKFVEGKWLIFFLSFSYAVIYAEARFESSFRCHIDACYLYAYVYDEFKFFNSINFKRRTTPVNSIVVYFIREENDSREEIFKRYVCNDFKSVEMIFPLTYTIAYYHRFKPLFSKLCCGFKCCICCKRSNRISDRSMQFMSTTRHAMEAPPAN
ncbi:unnamed protein product [Caenorhabditis angaria]|uniref:Uncharacterized protein n=1 Tax=Caenorhabditis angaria TaxID=860376 RepID=A0A9P1MX11_9PELO|nr:unnamed protein product [Caenorhabditis angaria]